MNDPRNLDQQIEDAIDQHDLLVVLKETPLPRRGKKRDRRKNKKK